MQQQLLRNKKYKGLGFVEALIAIAVSGIVSVVLMSISASALRELMKVDMQDDIAQHAVSTAVLVQKLAIEESYKEGEANLFKYDLQRNHCYTFNLDGTLKMKDHGYGTFSFPYESLDSLNNLKNEYDESVVEEGSDIFRIMCTTSEYNDAHIWQAGDNKMVVIIVTGSLKVDGRVTNDRDVKNYEYYSIIHL